MTKELSRVAKVSKVIRTWLKNEGIVAKVKSESGTYTDAIHINLVNANPALVEKINKEVCKYKSGYFDAMHDIYEYTNDKELNVEYIFINNDLDDEIREKAVNFIKNTLSGLENNDVFYWAQRILTGAPSCTDLSARFWNSL